MSDSKRTRDPMRRDRILEAAATLFSQHGYQAVNLNDIGTEAGIVGSGIYRHFANKMGILVELLDQLTDRLLRDADEIARNEPDALTALVALLSAQIERTIEDRELYLVYIQESRHLPEDDYERLRLKQRRYIAVWRDVLLVVRPELDAELARTTIHAAISATHSVLRYHSPVPLAQLRDELLAIGCRTLGVSGALPARTASPVEFVAS